MKPRRLPPLSALRAFEAAARHLSVKRAAEELSVTPTAISHQVRQLEAALGIAVFVRRPRRLQLTPQGRELMEVLGTAFDDIAEITTRLRSGPARQTITLSTTPAVAARWLLPWVCLLRDSHPQLDLRIHAGHCRWRWTASPPTWRSVTVTDTGPGWWPRSCSTTSSYPPAARHWP